MFQFAGLPPAPYVFRYGYRRITSGEFPHSEIPGSQDGQLLPQAFRSRPRPSSALGAKASAVCPCSLDQKNTGIDVAMEFSRCARTRAAPQRTPARGPVSQNSAARRNIEVDMLLGELGVLTAEAIEGPSAYHHEMAVSLERR